MLGEDKLWVDVVSSGGHGCEPVHTLFWSAGPQTSGTEAMVLGEPSMEKGRKNEERYKLVRATAALSREMDWTLLMDLSSGLEIGSKVWGGPELRKQGSIGEVREVSDFCGQVVGTEVPETD